MGRKATKAVGNICFEARKLAALDDARLDSREGAAELLNVHPTTLADYELGNVKAIPAEMMRRMSDLYKAPWLMTWFCEKECPIGCGIGLPVEKPKIEFLALGVARDLASEKVERIKAGLIGIASDGKVDEEERKELYGIVDQLSGLMHDIVGLMLMKRMVEYG